MTDAPTIFITGATDGLGRALAGRLAADGASLILHGRDGGKLESTAAEIAAAWITRAPAEGLRGRVRRGRGHRPLQSAGG